MATESTPLLRRESPGFVYRNFESSRSKCFNLFRCCLCTAIIIAIGGILFTTIYSSHFTTDHNNNSNESSRAANIFNTTWPLTDEEYRIEPMVNSREVRNAVNAGLESVAKRESLEADLPKMDVYSPSFRHQLSMKTTEKANELTKSALVFETAAKELMKRCNNRSNDHMKERVEIKWNSNDTENIFGQFCAGDEARVCGTSRYRTPDGSCNNLFHPTTWGVAMRPFRRILAPAYADGISEPRNSTDHLPSAREVSLTVHRALYRKDLDFTVMLAVWGQFVDHDMTATALSRGLNGESISCCLGYSHPHPECFPVELGRGDPFYEDYNVTCMDFVRSAPAPSCGFGPREQLNQASSFIDGSVIYGNDKRVMDSLRSFENGELKMLKIPSGEELLPISKDLNDGCNRKEQFMRGRYCFLTGDLRSNENLHLVSMHLIFARQHNLLARKLSALNPGWNDDKTFEESRKILSAQIQHITYKEFLPSILPSDLMNELNLTVRSSGYFRYYNSSVNPGIANSFAASAFRFGHSLLPGLFKLVSNDSSSKEYLELHKMLFNPFRLYDRDFLEELMRGALNTSTEMSDAYFDREVTQNLFKNEENKRPCGLDLVSLNIQRGRDHGLPGYTKWRIPCGLKPVESFDDLDAAFDPDSLENIRKLYKSVHDLDLFTGGLAEIPVKGSLLGPTFTCLLTDQFLRLKIGDRYWYENGGKPQAFTPKQLRELKKTSLAKIICDNTDIDEAQPMVMRRIGRFNRRRPCNKLQSPNLSLWKEL